MTNRPEHSPGEPAPVAGTYEHQGEPSSRGKFERPAASFGDAIRRVANLTT